MKLDVKVVTKSGNLNIRSGPGTSYRIVGKLSKGTVVTVNGVSGGFYKLSSGKGYISKSYTTVVKNYDNAAQKPPASSSSGSNSNTSMVNSTAAGFGIDAKIVDMLYKNASGNEALVDGSTRLFGSPYQFIHQTDYRYSKQINLGRQYLQNIVPESPIVYFMPGKPSYMPEADKAEKEAMTSFLAGKTMDSNNKSIMDEILNEKESRYFGFKPAYTEYIRYVNLMCRVCAIYLGIGERTAPKSVNKYKSFNWSNYLYYNKKTKEEVNKSVFSKVADAARNAVDELFDPNQYVPFYVDGGASFSESASNNTMQSKVVGMMEGVQDIVKEIAFLSDAAALKNVDKARQTFSASMDEIAQKMMNGNNEGFFSRVLGMSSNIVGGANLIFPELWGDSDYSKSYNIVVNLVSPYGDKESIYLNIIVPLMHIIALALPRQSTPNSYSAPFLVRTFCKGWFSSEMGIIDSISIDKGGNGESWSVNGLPTEVKVTISVKDLYNNLMVSSEKNSALFFQNQGLMEFLAVTCGVNLTIPQLQLKLDTMFQTLFNKVNDIPSNWYQSFMEGLKNKIDQMLGH